MALQVVGAAVVLLVLLVRWQRLRLLLLLLLLLLVGCWVVLIGETLCITPPAAAFPAGMRAGGVGNRGGCPR